MLIKKYLWTQVILEFFQDISYPDSDPKNPTKTLLNLLNPKLCTKRVPF